MAGRVGRVEGLALWMAVLLAALLSARCGREEPRKGPNVILLVPDALRADHLGVYGSEEGLTPRIDAFSRRAALFRNATAQAPATIASSASMFTSVFPSEHGYFNYELAVSEEHTTLAERLAEKGYETFGISTNPHVSSRNGLGQGFDTFIENWSWTGTKAEEINAVFLDWIDQRTGSGPFFAMLWYIDTHVPYDPPRALVRKYVPRDLRPLVSKKTRAADKELDGDGRLVARQLYQGTVAYFDEAFGDLMEELEDRDLFDDTMIILTSDHGESFWERVHWSGSAVSGHGSWVYKEQLLVPLVIKFPGAGPTGRFDPPANVLDIFPTVLDTLGFEGHPRIRGVSLLERIKGGTVPGEAVPGEVDLAGSAPARSTPAPPALAYSEMCHTGIDGPIKTVVRSIADGQGKLVVTHRYRGKAYEPPREEFLDLRDDEIDVAAGGPEVGALREKLRAAYAEWVKGMEPLPPGRAPETEKRNELIERLKELGYAE